MRKSMITTKQWDDMLDQIVKWAVLEEKRILEQGVKLNHPYVQIARNVGVNNPEKIRVLEVSEVPLPNIQGLQTMLSDSNTSNILAMTIRYGIFVRVPDWKSDRRMLTHELVHSMQYERAGSVEKFLSRYLFECLSVGISQTSSELEATSIEEKICGKR